MPDESTYPFYVAYCKNVKDFLIAEKEIKRSINRSLKRNNENSVNINTKIYALIYSTYSEARFMKMILTPHGFEQTFVNQILEQKSIESKWHKCLEFAFKKFTSNTKNSEIPNKLQELKRLIGTFIIDPSIIRNKVAHGQLTIALNKENTAINPKLTSAISTLDVTKVYIWFKVNSMLCEIIEELIESPNKAHHRNYYIRYQELTEFIKRSRTWTIENKMHTPSMSKTIPTLRSN